MYNALLQVKPGTAELGPELAESYEMSEDGTAYTFKLRQGVKFHDGSEVQAKDVKYSFDRMLDLKKGAYRNLNMVASAEVVDDYTVVVNLEAPFGPFLMALPRFYILNADLVKENEQDGDWGEAWLVDNDAGSGPYVLTSFEREQQFVLEKFPDYFKGWDGKHVDRAVFRIIREDASRQLALEQGEADWSLIFNPEIWSALEGASGITVGSHATENVLYVVFNHNNEYLQDVRIRQALSLVYDREGHVESLALGHAEVARGPLAPTVPCFDDSIQPAETNMEKAKELMAEAGYPDGGFEFDMLVDNNPREQATGELMASNAAELGITIKPIPMEWSARLEIWADQPTAQPMGTVYVYPKYSDPDQFLHRLTHSSSAPGGNFAWYSNPQMDELLEAARSELDPDKRCEIYKEAQQLWLEDVPYAAIVVEKGLTAMRDYVKGFQWTPIHGFTASLYDMYLEGKP
jgi:peptide/nickel transport system substrate-binding protein